ncbi:MAG TPA: GAP family protein, partial [Candidatus Limnocylindrales bacterium]|nr:GAP family protein [Candidatus Limnocylindrales bacterium]
AVRTWLKRPSAGEEPALPGWMSSIDHVAPGRALVLGGVLALANPKQWAFALVAATSIGQSGITGSEEWLAILVFVVFSSLTVLVAIAYELIAPERATVVLAQLKDFMSRNNTVIMVALFVLFGVKLLLSGLDGLF